MSIFSALLRKIRVLNSIVIVISCVCLAGEANSKDWTQTTENDLFAMRELIVSSHPGVLDTNNKGFAEWLDKGYLESINLSTQVKSERDSLAVLNFYIAGFQDGHVNLHRPTQEKSFWAGFVLGMQGVDFVVKSSSKNWPIPLPSIGSKVVSCDKKLLPEIIKNEISPYIDRRLNLKSTWLNLATYLTVDYASRPTMGRTLPKSCLIVLPNGVRQNFTLLWQEERGELKPFLDQPQPPQTLQSLGGGRYWVHVSNFSPSASDNASLDTMLTRIKNINDANLVVLDTRGNRGGNSLVGIKILTALLGSQLIQSLDEQSRAYAMWRVSPFAISTLDNALSSMENNYGKNSESYKFVFELTTAMKFALHNRQDWLRQPSTVSDGQDQLKEIDSRSFKGKLVLVTDSFCASACLDFVDVVRSIPRTIHVGLPTSADTLYIDVGSQLLPSGAQFWLPLKVWRDRRRGNNQSYDPQLIFHGDINDTSAVKSWVFESL